MILVTGSTGLVGAHLLYHLSKQDTPIRALYRTKAKIETVKHVFSYFTENVAPQFSKIEWIQGDINDLASLTAAFKNITHVYHCAALVSFNPDDYYTLRKVNIKGTANIVNFCIDFKIEKLCYVSSIAAIDDELGTALISETNEWNPEAPHSVYAITKYGAELEVWRGTQEGLNTVIVNPGIIIGGGYWRSSSGALFKRVYKGITRFTKGSSGYIDIHDVVGVMQELMQSSIKNERYILVNENLTFKDFLTQVAVALKVPIPKKEASPFLLQIAWRLDWLRYQFKKNYRALTKEMASTLSSTPQYDTQKIKKALPEFKFTPIQKSIEATAALFLKDL
jgi:nucleoside-diphosphate-sugar epimerase